MWVGRNAKDLERQRGKFLAGLGQTNGELSLVTADYVATADAGSGFDWSAISGIVGDITQTYLSVEQMRMLQETNAARLAQGLPPVSASQLAPTANVGVAPGTQTMLYIIVGILAAAFVLPALLKGRR